MNLSLYLLFTEPFDSKAPIRDNRAPRNNARQHTAAAVGPVRPCAIKRSTRPQASRCLAALETNCRPIAGKLGFAVGVVCNAAGFLLLTSGLLLLLQIAQASLS